MVSNQSKYAQTSWLLHSFATALLTLLGAAGGVIGYDCYFKSNTAKHGSHSLFRQGIIRHELIRTMPVKRLPPSTKKFAAMLAEIPVSANPFQTT